jgi:hypothetical protein
MSAVYNSRQNFIKKTTIAGIVATGFSGIEILADN